MIKIIIIFVLWRVFITLAMIFGLMLPVQTTYLGAGAEKYFENPLLYSWANFDGVHYWSIASVGYKQFEQAFFPLYPILIKTLESLLKINTVVSGLLISHATFLLASIFLYKLIKIDYTENVALWTVVFLMFSPVSFYFGSVYTESLFLLLCILSFYLLKCRQVFWSGLFGLLASATRIVGVFLLPFLLTEYWQKNNKDIKNKRKILKFDLLWLMLVPVGLVLYMIWLQYTYQDALYFFHAQPLFGANRSINGLILPPQVAFRYLKIFFTASFNYQYVIAVYEFLATVCAYIILFLGFKKIRLSYFLFSLSLLTVPILTGTLLSMPRFIITVFPLFLIIPLIFQSKFKRVVVLVVFMLFLFFSTMFFTRGYWIA